MPQTKNPTITRNSNAAGAPLPLIPRRANSATRIGNVSNKVPRSNISLNIVSQSHPGEGHAKQVKAVGLDSGFSRSGKTGASTPTEQQEVERGTETAPIISEQSSVIGPDANYKSSREFDAPARPPSIQVYVTTPSLNNTARIRHLSECLKPDRSPPVHDREDAPQSRLVRKKSGQLVKSSLKSSTSCSKSGLSIVTLGNTSKSEPTTPMLTKVVHFDSQLEHVKLFLAEQKPLAVSRDGSPTDDTSGTDNDFPSFIFGSSNERKSENALSMKVKNMPPSINKLADVALEDLSLASEGTVIIGRVRLRNIAYTKVLAARFTFDDWLTTSEVIGKYLATIDVAFDRFTFIIRLQDILPRIEGKTLIFALRYAVAGREIWDNNHGRNYIATFSSNVISQDEAGSSHGIADLRSRLEKVARRGDRSCQHNQSQGSRLLNDGMNALRPSVSLTSRYDYESSVKRQWAQSTKSETCPDKTKLGDVNSIPWPKATKEVAPYMPVPTLGSPRDLDADTFQPVAHIASDVDQMPFFVPSRPIRHHQRGYFDVNRGNPGLKRTPSGAPHRNDGMPLQDSTLCLVPIARNRHLSRGPERSISLKLENSGSGSDESTPSITTLSTSRSTTPSPCPTENETEDMVEVGTVVDPGLSHSPTTRYRQFINR
jgi:hypothetical protein